MSNETEQGTGVDAALASLNAELTNKNEALAEKDDALKLAEEKLKLLEQELVAQQNRNTALAELNKKIEAAKAAAEERAERESPGANMSQASSKARHRIILDEVREGHEGQEVDVGVNGRAYKLKRGVPVDVPWDVIHVLDNAVIGRATPVEDPVTKISAGVQYTDGRRFPYRYIRQVIDDNGNEIPEKR